MTIEERLRDTLDRKASDARMSADAWDRITERAERRTPRPWMIPSLALGTATAVVLAAVAFIGDDTSRVVTAPADRTPATGGPVEGVRPVSAFPGIWPENTWDAYEAEDASVREGHQPWRLDPVEVARRYVDERGFGGDVLVDPIFEPYPEDRSCGNVPYTVFPPEQDEKGSIELCHLGESAAYYVTAAQSDRMPYDEPLYESPLEIPVGIAVPGTLTARAGAFDSEWIDEVSQEITAGEIVGPGYEVGVTLELGDDLPDALLVQLVHQSALDGSKGFAEFRLDLTEDSPEARFPHAQCDAGPPDDLTEGVTEPDEALRGWMAQHHGEQATVEHYVDGPVDLANAGSTIVGTRSWGDDGVRICVVSYWANPGAGEDGLRGFTEDVAALTFADGAWVVGEVRRGALVDTSFETVSVVMLNPQGECGETDREFTAVDLPIPVGQDPFSAAVRQLITGLPWRSDLHSEIPAHARLNSLEISDRGVVRVDFTPEIQANNSSCAGNAKVEQIRRTVLAQEGATDVVITVNGEEAELIG